MKSVKYYINKVKNTPRYIFETSSDNIQQENIHKNTTYNLGVRQTTVKQSLISKQFSQKKIFSKLGVCFLYVCPKIEVEYQRISNTLITKN